MHNIILIDASDMKKGEVAITTHCQRNCPFYSLLVAELTDKNLTFNLIKIEEE
jgi:hypothetical protein